MEMVKHGWRTDTDSTASRESDAHDGRCLPGGKRGGVRAFVAAKFIVHQSPLPSWCHSPPPETWVVLGRARGGSESLPTRCAAKMRSEETAGMIVDSSAAAEVQGPLHSTRGLWSSPLHHSDVLSEVAREAPRGCEQQAQRRTCRQK